MSTQESGGGGTPRVIPNVNACIDCGACEVACKRTWDLPQGDDRIQVVPLAHGTEDEANQPMQCYNCAEAACVEVCPTEALHYREDGTVRVDSEKCIGCHYCGVGCPFGAPQYPDDEIPEAQEEDPMGTKSGGLMDKCTTCQPRQEQGLEPACASECPTDALIFGTPDEISSKLREESARTLFSSGAAQFIFGADADEVFTE